MDPSDDDLRRFLLGLLPPDRAAAVADWVERTPGAAAALARVDADDTLVAALSDRSNAATPPGSLTVTAPIDTGTEPLPDPDRRLPRGYRYVRELGRGGMGVVFEAVEEPLGRRVAVKVMRPELAALATAKARFLREARLMAAVEDDHIAPLFRVDETADGSPFLVMPLLSGETLADRLKRGPLPTAELVRVARDTALGLAAAHARGLIHRDIKPSNLWLEAARDGSFRRVRVLDFGLAREEEPLTDLSGSGQVSGTPAYMSPEQARGAPLDRQTDLFSLGVVLYRAATGRPPFQGETASAVLTALAVDTPPLVRELAPAVPAALGGIIEQLLAKKPADRPPSAQAVVVALDRIAADPPAAARAPSGSEPSKSRPRRALAVAAVLLACGLAALGGWVVIKVRNQDGVETTLKVPDGSHVTVAPDGSVTVAPPKGTDPSVIPPAGELTERSSAEWVLRKGGGFACVIPSEGGRRVDVRRPEDLPARPFVVHTLWLTGEAAGQLTDETVGNLGGFSGVTTLFLDRQPLTDAGWEKLIQLRGFRTLGELDAGDTALTAAAIRTLPSLPNLAVFSTRVTATRADDLAPLKDCAKLKRLTFNVRGMPAAGYTHLRGLGVASLGVGGSGAALPAELLDAVASMPGLAFLHLSDWDARAADPGRLKGLRYLTHLWLSQTELAPDGLASLAAWPALWEVRIWLGQNADAHLANLGKMPKLATLMFNLSQTVTDAGLAALHGTKSLTLIECWGCPKLTAAGVQKLSAAVPGCLIKSDHGAFKGGSRQPDSPAAPDKMAARRKAAEWVWASGGNVVIRLDDGTERGGIGKAADLPPKFELARLGIRAKGVTDEALIGHLPALAEAAHLDFWSCHELTDASVTQLAKFPRLQTLRLVGMPGVTDRTLSAFSGHPALALLVLCGNRITPDGLKHLRTMKSLEQLSLEQLPITDAWLAELAPLTQLTHLGLGLTAPPGRITAAGAAHLKGMKRLQLLNLNAAAIDDEAMASVATLPALVNLDLQSSQVGDGGMELLVGCPRLTQINLSKSRVTGAGVRHLARLPALEFAQLYHVPVGDEDAKALAASKSLKVVWLAFSGVGDEGAIALARMPQLVELDLAACRRVTDRTAGSLADHPTLRSFGSDSPELTDAAVRHLATNTELQVLALPGTAVTDASVPAISGLKKLGRLDLTRSKVTPAGFAALRDALPKCEIAGAPPADVMAERRKALAWLRGIKAEVHLLLPGDRWLAPGHYKDPLPPEFEVGMLVLRDNATVTDADFKAHLPGLDGLRHLDLSGCPKVTDDAAALLVKLPKLRWLFLGWQPGVTDRTFAALAGHPELRTVKVGHIKLSDAAFTEFAAMPKLDHLNVNPGPDRTSVTAKGLAELERSASLRHLQLANVAVTPDHLRAVGRIAGLHKLEVNQSQIPTEGFDAIAGLKNLTHLYLSETNVGDAHLRKLPPLATVTDLAVRISLVGDEGLTGLEKWPALTTLILDRTEVKGDGLKHLAKCPKLEKLTLDHNPVTPEGLIAVAESKTITELRIEGTQMTDAAAAAIAGMAKLDWIHAVGCNVTDAQCKAFSLSQSLRKVGVSGPQLTDKAVANFVNKPQITVLAFLDSGLTDSSYPALKGMKHLVWLDVSGSRITPTGVGALRKELPKCKVLPRGRTRST